MRRGGRTLVCGKVSHQCVVGNELMKGMFHIIVLYCAVYSLGYDGSLLNGLQALPMWQSDFG
jgi:hypothetical protein